MDFLVLIVGFFYFLPAIAALGRKKRNAGAIQALNLFLGWTLVGWVVALVWALTYDEKKTVVVQQSVQPAGAPRLCSYCGRYSEVSAKFCSVCGKPLVAQGV